MHLIEEENVSFFDDEDEDIEKLLVQEQIVEMQDKPILINGTNGSLLYFIIVKGDESYEGS